MPAKLDPFTFRRRFPNANWWLGHQDELVCYAPSTGRVRAFIRHDGHDQYSFALFGNLFETLKVLRSGIVTKVSVRAFPLCIVDLAPIECTDIAVAKGAIEEFLADHGIADFEEP